MAARTESNHWTPGSPSVNPRQHPDLQANSSLRSYFVQKSSGRPGNFYEAQLKLGEGTFGVAHLVVDRRSGLQRVLKTINKHQSQVPPAQLEREISNLKACDHPHIIRLFEYYEDYENIYLIMERAAGGELHQVLLQQKNLKLSLPERWVTTVTRQCLMAISYVHSQGIVHKDLKSENILLLNQSDVSDPATPPHAVIIDLGIAEIFAARMGRHARCTVVAGTPTHMAPEVWMGNFGPVADVWSLGVVLFELLSGEIPFLCSSLNSVHEWIRMHKLGPSWSLLRHTSGRARALCQRMLSWDERMRPTAQQCLGHSWFKGAEDSAEEVAEIGAGDAEAAVPPPLVLGEMETIDLETRLRGSIEAYKDRSNFEKVVLLQAASQLHTSQIVRVADIFAAADGDSSGVLSRTELASALQGLGVEPGNAEAYAHCLDADGDGKVEYTEFVAACIGMLYESLRGLLWQSFCMLDVDGNGVLRKEEIHAVVTRAELVAHGFPGNGTSRSINEVLERMDVDRDDQVSFDELCQHFLPPRPALPASSRAAAVSAPGFGDEEFAQLLDEIEGTTPEPVLGWSEVVPGGRGLMSADDCLGFSGAASMTLVEVETLLAPSPEVEVDTLLAPSPEPESGLAAARALGGAAQAPAQNLTVEEELSHLLADIADGP